MRIVVVGTGYVGLVAGTGFAEFGNRVTCVDTDAEKIRKLKEGRIPIYEPGLEELVRRNAAEQRLAFSTDLAAAVADTDMVFVAVGTPPREDGGADLKYVMAVAESLAEHLQRDAVVVLKSTVPVGTNDRVQSLLDRDAKVNVTVVSNPEFLKEGDAVNDFLKPDRVLIGARDDHGRNVMKKLYAPLQLTGERLIFVDPRSAELAKYVANAMLAVRISFMNDIARLCEAVGADVTMVRRGVGSDHRIGPKFLFAGAGYGGSCLDGDETVLVREGSRTELRTLRALFEQASVQGAMPPGVEARPLREVEVLAWRPGDEAPGYYRASHVTRRRYEGEMVSLVTKMGRRVRCTEDHPFVTVDSRTGRTEVTLARDLTTDHWLPLAQRRETEGQALDRIDTLASIAQAGLTDDDVIVRAGPEGLARLRELGAAEIAATIESLGGDRPARERATDILRAGALRLHEARALGLPLDDATFGTARNGTYIPRHLPVDRALLRVLGLYLAEGHVSADGDRRRVMWSFHPTDEMDLVDEVVAFWRSVDVECDVRRGTTAANVSISSRLLGALFVGVLGLGGDCYSHRLPDFVWSLPRDLKLALVEGMWLGDGSWSLIAGGPSVVFEYGTVSRSLADGLLRLLGDLGVCARQKVGRTTKSTCDTHWLVVSGADQIEPLVSLIPAVDRQPVRDSIAAQAKRIEPTGYRRLSGGVTALRVKSIEREPFHGEVYSLEVPGVETWVSTGGLIVHNCFPKDVDALLFLAKENGIDLALVRATEEVNDRQKNLLFDKLKRRVGDLAGKRVAVWGLAFKPRTDDVREAPALRLIAQLVEAGAEVRAHDPAARATARAALGSLANKVIFVDHPYDATVRADALVLVTEWQEYRSPDFELLGSQMTQRLLIDGRNVWGALDPEAQGFVYEGIGLARKGE
jgi:UDPglucose 6-dehydrogenase